MHQFISRWHKVAGIVVMTYAVLWAGTQCGFGWIKLGTTLAVVDGVVVYLLAKSWPLLQTCIRACSCFRKLVPGWATFDLRGEWTGTLQSEWRDEQGNRSGPKVVNLTVSQAWDKIVLTLKTDEITGTSTYAIPSYDANTEELRIGYFFSTSPKAAVAQKNPPQQYGCAVATIRIAKPNQMHIRYTNERSPGGDITLNKA